MSNPAPDTGPRAATYDDLLALPENLVGEILNGTLHTQPRPAPRHAAASTSLSAVLGGEFDGSYSRAGGWRILFEPELHLDEDVLVPDIAGWRLPRLATLPDTAWIELAPDWVCEVLSPSTAGRDRVIKQAIYARENVGHLWFVDPLARTVEVFALDGQPGDDAAGGPRRWTLVTAVEADAEVALPPFESLSFPLARLWA